MTEILWIKHPVDSRLNGTRQHVSKGTAQNRIEGGEAVLVPCKTFQERLAAHQRELDEQNKNKPPLYPPRGWVLARTTLTSPAGDLQERVSLVSHDGFGTRMVHGSSASARAAGCPEALCVEFDALRAGEMTPQQLEAMREAAAERAQRQRQQMEADAKNPINNPRAVLARMGYVTGDEVK